MDHRDDSEPFYVLIHGRSYRVVNGIVEPDPWYDEMREKDPASVAREVAEVGESSAGVGGMTRVIICDTYGGFGLSRDAFLRLRELGCAEALAEPDWGEHYHDGSGPRQEIPMEMFGRDVPRDHPALLQVFDEMGEMAAGKFCHLALIEIPDDVFWHIEEYDGSEWIAEDHRTWYSSYE